MYEIVTGADRHRDQRSAGPCVADTLLQVRDYSRKPRVHSSARGKLSFDLISDFRCHDTYLDQLWFVISLRVSERHA